MRLGKWIRIFDRIVPIPMTFASSFGLREGSQLYLAPMTPESGASGDAEIIVSPVPTVSWRSVCRLSVRLHDKCYALATATSFLRERRISILLTEAAGTFQERAHWDALCDLQTCTEFAAIGKLPYTSYEQAMVELLAKLSEELQHWATKPSNRDVFLSGADAHAVFTPLTGLNIASFRCNLVPNHKAPFRAGGITLPHPLVREIKNTLGGNGGLIAPVPSHAFITGNTEQRYLRLYFIRNVEEFVTAEVEFDIGKIAGEGIGMLNQILCALPKELNLVHFSLHRIQHPDGAEKGVTRFTGVWRHPEELSLRMEGIDIHKMKHDILRQTIECLEIEDVSGQKYPALAKLLDFSTPTLLNPRVFISYSIQSGSEHLTLLRNALIENNFDPVVGTDVGERPYISGHPVAPDVAVSAFEQIPKCVAFISLQLKRPDFQHNSGKFLLPPWAIAEEVFAYARGVSFLARLRERGVDDPRYNKNTLEYEFGDNEEFRARVVDLMRELNKLRQDQKFENTAQMARHAQFKPRHSPD